MSKKNTKAVTTDQLNAAVAQWLSGGAKALVGEWRLTLYVRNELADVIGGKVPTARLEAVANAIGTAFRSAGSEHGTVDLNQVNTAPDQRTIRNWLHASVLAPHVLNEAQDTITVPMLHRPSTVVQYARKADAFKLLQDDPAAFADKYPQVVEAARVKSPAKAERKTAKAAEGAEGAEGTAANSDQQLPTANPLVAELVKQLQAALDAHGAKAVSDAVLPALRALGTPAKATGKTAAASKAASARPAKARTVKPAVNA